MLLILLATICLFGLFDHSLWSSNDTREGSMISEMVRTHCWFAPVFNGEYYLEKPPLLHWTGVLLCRIFGVVNEGLVRLPAALYGFFTLLIVLAWARALGREEAGFAAVFMCATSVLYLEYSRIVLTDSALTFMVIFSLWLFWRAYTVSKWIAARYLLFLFVSAFSFYAKGLIGPGLIWLSVLAWLSFQKRLKLMLVLMIVFGFVFVLVLAPWVFALWKTGGSHYLYTVFWENQFGRFLYFDDQTLPLDPYLVHKEPIYYYLFVLPVRLMPWTLLVVPALIYWYRRSSPLKGQIVLFLKISLLAFVFLLHISSAKAPCYVLPLFPIIFLMTAVWLEDTSELWSSRTERWLIGITFGLLGITIVAAPAAYIIAFLLRFQVVWTPGVMPAVLCCVMALIAVLTGLFFLKKIWEAFKEGRRRAALLAMPAVVAVVGVVGMAPFIPAIDFHRTYVPLAKMVSGEINAGRRIAFPSDSERDLGAFMFYLDSRLETVTLTNCEALISFLKGEGKSVGIVVPIKELRPVLSQLRNLPLKIRKSSHDGRKSNAFRLIILDPPVKTQAGQPKQKSGKPKRAAK